jgi:hypothetical protein
MPDLLYALVQLVNLVQETRSAVLRLEAIDHKLYVDPLDRIQEVLVDVNFEAPWSNYSSRLNDVVLNSLQYVAERLSWTSSEVPIERKVLDEMRQEVEALASDVLNAELPGDLRELIIERLEEIRRALLVYRLNGASGLKRTVDESVGVIFRHREEILPQAKQPLVSRFFGLLRKADSVASFALKVKELCGPMIGKMIGSGDSDEV